MVQFCFSLDSLNTMKYAIGFGTALNTNLYYFPIKISDNLRIEPEYQNYKSKNDRYFEKNEYLDFEIGTGIFYTDIENKVLIYYGIRLGYRYNLEKHTTSEYSDKSYIFGPAIGGEYFLIDRFSLGVELKYGYGIVNVKKIINELTEKYTRRGSETKARFFMRFYLF